jgi:hypothetical protein
LERSWNGTSGYSYSIPGAITLKFAFDKSQVIKFFAYVNKLEKTRLVQRDNKPNALVFFPKDNNLNIFLENGISGCYFDLAVSCTEDHCFSIDSSSFFNAISNFPVDEIQFAYVSDKNSLILGNKKTKVVLETSSPEDVEKSYMDAFVIASEYNELNSKNLHEAITNTVFCTAPEYDEFPYSSLLLFEEEELFHSVTSDKHRIAIFGNSYSEQKSLLLSKISCDLITSVLGFSEEHEYSFAKNKLFIKWHNGIFFTSCENNTYQSVFQNLVNFFQEAKDIFSVSIPRDELQKSMKFISSISSSHIVKFTFKDNILNLSAVTSGKGGASDKITLEENTVDFEATYLTSHLIKLLDHVEKNVVFHFKNYNDFSLLVVESKNTKYLIFPMQ